MDRVLLDVLGDPPAAAPDAHDAAGRLRDLWLGGMPLPRAAATAGLSVADAQEILTRLGFQPPPSRREQAGKLRTLVEAGLSPAQIAGRLDLTEEQVRTRMGRAGLPLPPKATEIQAAEAVRLYREGLSMRAVAGRLGTHHRTVWRDLDRAGVPRRPRGTAGTTLSRRQLERLYVEDRLSVAEIARRFDVSPQVVARNLDRHAIPRQRPPLDRATLDELYSHQRLGIRAIAARLEVTATKVRADLAHHGIPVRQPGRPRTSA